GKHHWPRRRRNGLLARRRSPCSRLFGPLGLLLLDQRRQFGGWREKAPGDEKDTRQHQNHREYRQPAEGPRWHARRIAGLESNGTILRRDVLCVELGTHALGHIRIVKADSPGVSPGEADRISSRGKCRELARLYGLQV